MQSPNDSGLMQPGKQSRWFNPLIYPSHCFTIIVNSHHEGHGYLNNRSIMAQLDYDKKLSRLMKPEIMAALGNVREHRGRQSLYIATKPDVLDKLCEVAKIQSTGASNRIENISTTDALARADGAEDGAEKHR